MIGTTIYVFINPEASNPQEDITLEDVLVFLVVPGGSHH